MIEISETGPGVAHKHIELQEAASHIVRSLQEAIAFIVFLGESPDQLQRVDALPHPEAELLIFFDNGLAGLVCAARSQANGDGPKEQEHHREESQPNGNQEHEQDEDDERAEADHQTVGEAQCLTDLPGIVGNCRDDVRAFVFDPVVDAGAYCLVEDPRSQPMRNETIDISGHPSVDEMDRILEENADAQHSDQECSHDVAEE